MQKNCDTKNRWRSKTVAFRMSPEEAAQLDALVRLSGLNKQDYLIHRALQREVVVNGNPRVYKALRNQMADIFQELLGLHVLNSENTELLELIQQIAVMMNGLSDGSAGRAPAEKEKGGQAHEIGVQG